MSVFYKPEASDSHCKRKTNKEVTAIKLIIRKAIPFPLRSGCWAGISSKIVNNVLVDRQQNTQKSAKDNKRPAKGAAYTPLEAK